MNRFAITRYTRQQLTDYVPTLSRAMNQLETQYNNARSLLFIKYIYESQHLIWESKYTYILAEVAEMRRWGEEIAWHDPDTSYEEDARACVEALRKQYTGIWETLPVIR